MSIRETGRIPGGHFLNQSISTMYFHNMSCDLLNKILFKPIKIVPHGFLCNN